jgi:tetratricopeptide (TPR) repeat protein
MFRQNQVMTQQATTMDQVWRHRLLGEAEGYLDLVTVLGDRWRLDPVVRDPVARRALQLVEQLRRAGDESPEVFHLEGQVLRVMEQYEAAIEPLMVAAEARPDNVHVWLALGWCYKRVGRLDLAIESLEEALAFEPSEAIVHYNLACYWSLANSPQLALGYLRQAFELSPRYRDLVAGEPDFDPIRNEPGFRALVSVIV